MTDGILLIDKPKGWSSFDVVAKLRGRIKHETGVKKPKVGHTGTLDPLATGLMVIVVGTYCKRAAEFSKMDKTYEVTMRLGEVSTTGDDEGEKTPISTQRPKRDELIQAIEQFVGTTQQTPPIYSAIKVDGKRAYDLARAGKEVKLEPREVTVYFIEDVRYDYPHVTFRTRVSSGTYIRSLVADIGEVLETGAYMSDLRRTSVGNWGIEHAFQIEDITNDIIKHRLLEVSE